MPDSIVKLQNEIVCTYRQIMGCDHDCQNCNFRLEDIEIINALEAALAALKEKQKAAKKKIKLCRVPCDMCPYYSICHQYSSMSAAAEAIAKYYNAEVEW